MSSIFCSLSDQDEDWSIHLCWLKQRQQWSVSADGTIAVCCVCRGLGLFRFEVVACTHCTAGGTLFLRSRFKLLMNPSNLRRIIVMTLHAIKEMSTGDVPKKDSRKKNQMFWDIPNQTQFIGATSNNGIHNILCRRYWRDVSHFPFFINITWTRRAIHNVWALSKTGTDTWVALLLSFPLWLSSFSSCTQM